MSKIRAIKAINGEFSDRIPQWDFPDSPVIAEKLFTYDIWENTERTSIDLLKYFDIDMVPCIPGGIAEWNFPLVRYYSEVEYLDGPMKNEYMRAYPKISKKPYKSLYDSLGRVSRASWWGMAPTMAVKSYGFDSPEDVLKFEPLEIDKSTLSERREFFIDYYSQKQALLGDNCLLMGWYYNTLFMWPVEIFGWENFMIAAMLDPQRFKEILM